MVEGKKREAERGREEAGKGDGMTKGGRKVDKEGDMENNM